MNRSSLLLSLVLPFTFLACNTTSGPKPQENSGASTSPVTSSGEAASSSKVKAQGPVIEGKVLEVIDVSNYTYLSLETSAGKVWAAVPKAQIAVGAQVTVEQPMPMKKFHSPTLNRDFDEIYFGVLKGPGGPTAANPHGNMVMPSGSTAPAGAGAAPLPIPSSIVVPKATGADAYTVAEIVKQGAKLKGKTVTIQAMVVKSNNGIMERNWLHIQDGSGAAQDKSNDLILTTQETAQVGSVVTIRGKVSTDRDFGSGYSYPIMLEEAVIVPAKTK